MDQASRKRSSHIVFPLVFLAFLVAFFAPLSAKSVNNIFYVGLALPAFIWWACAIRIGYRPFLVAPAFFVFFGLLSVYLAFKTRGFFMDTTYLVLLFMTCVMLERNDGTVRKVYGAFALVCFALLGVAVIEWAIVVNSAGTAPRIALWGHAENPNFAALMIISSLVFLWMFYLEERLASVSETARWSGFVALAALCLACAVVFQARSSLLGFGLFVLGYAARGKYFKPIALSAIAASVLLLLSGWGAALLERGLSFRPAIWEAVLRRLVDTCGVLTGCGKDDFLFLGEFLHPHSAYLSILYYGGLVGLALFAAMAAAFFVRSWRGHSRWLMVALVGWGGVVTTTSGVIASPRPVWVFFWIPTLMALLETGRPALEAYYRARDEVRARG